MKDLKKIEEKDIVFVDKQLSEKDEREFSKFLKSRKMASQHPSSLKPVAQ